MGSPSAPPGWYPDPSGLPGQRYFDGIRWTDFCTGPPPQRQRRRISRKTLVAVIVGACAAIAVLLAPHDPGPPYDDASYHRGYSDGRDALQAGTSPGVSFCRDSYESKYRAGATNVKRDYIQGCLDAGGQR
jgi:hypothetical protein